MIYDDWDSVSNEFVSEARARLDCLFKRKHRLDWTNFSMTNTVQSGLCIFHHTLIQKVTHIKGPYIFT